MRRGVVRLCRSAGIIAGAFVFIGCSGQPTLHLLHGCAGAIEVSVSGGDGDTEVTITIVEPGESTAVRTTCCDPNDDRFTVEVSGWTTEVRANDHSLNEPFELPAEACEA